MTTFQNHQKADEVVRNYQAKSKENLEPKSKGILELFLPPRQLLFKGNLHFSFDGLNIRTLEL